MKKLLLSLFLAAILFSCKSDDYTCPNIEYGVYKGSVYIYEIGQAVECGMGFYSDGASLSYTIPGSKRKQFGTTYSCKNSVIIFDPISKSDGDLTGLIPLKYTYDAKRKMIMSVDDGENTFGDVVVTFYRKI